MKPELIESLLQIALLLGSLAAGIYAKIAGKEKKKLKRENEYLKDNIYRQKIVKIKELMDLQRFSSMEKAILKCFDSTQIDRFSVMFVMNGKTEFKFLTVLYDQSEIDHNLGSISPYTRFPIDHNYKKMLAEIEEGSFVWRSDKDFGVGLINDYLDLEMIRLIGWAFIKRIPIDEQNDIVVYCSFSSTSTSALSLMELRKIELMFTGKILPEMQCILHVPDMEDDELLNNLK